MSMNLYTSSRSKHCFHPTDAKTSLLSNAVSVITKSYFEKYHYCDFD